MIPERAALAVDGHVHFHRRAWIEPALLAAAGNFSRVAPGADPAGVLLLTQTTEEDHFEWLREQREVGEWRVERAGREPQTLWMSRGRERLLVVCGSQIQAERGLEVLALGTDVRFAERLGIERTLDEVAAAGALAALPWGFGKWTGHRAARIRGLIERYGKRVWLGDNGGRLRGVRRPRLLAEGERHGARVLPGTDPFPFGGDYRRVGSFGCLLQRTLDEQRPWASIAGQLERLEHSPRAYGRATGWLRFGVNQIWIQAHMRLHTRTPGATQQA